MSASAAPPPKLLKLARDLFADETEQVAFCDTVLKRHPYKPALVWLRERPAAHPFKCEDPQAWQPDFVDRLRRDQRPGQDPLHAAGHYYCMTFSSVFESCVFGVVPPEPELVVDLCAAPGGKSVFAARLLRPRMLVANEVIQKRTAQLIANFRRCAIAPAMVTAQDSATLAERAPACADLVIVDAPCSGQSLIAKGKQVTGCFHNHIINHNRNRQRRILGNAVKLVQPGGHLAYLTCTYAEKENEGNLRWLLEKFPEFAAVPVPALASFQSRLADFPCYRMWPQDGLGAGGFAAVLKNHCDGDTASRHPSRFDPVWNSSVR